MLCPHRANQDSTANAGGCEAIVNALVNFCDVPDVACAVVQAGRALVAGHQFNMHCIQSLAFNATTTQEHTKSEKHRNKAVSIAIVEILGSSKQHIPSK